MSQIIHSNGKTFEVIKKEERTKCTHTLEEAMEEARKYTILRSEQRTITDELFQPFHIFSRVRKVSNNSNANHYVFVAWIDH